MSGDDENILVCERTKSATQQYFTDDLFGICSACGHLIRYRPHAPKVKRICRECYAEVASEDDKFTVTDESLAELRRRWGH